MTVAEQLLDLSVDGMARRWREISAATAAVISSTDGRDGTSIERKKIEFLNSAAVTYGAAVKLHERYLLVLDEVQEELSAAKKLASKGAPFGSVFAWSFVDLLDLEQKLVAAHEELTMLEQRFDENLRRIDAGEDPSTWEIRE